MNTSVLTAPSRAIDSHAHIFVRGLPLATQRRHTPDYDATLDAYRAHLTAHGLTHGVLVQPSFLGTDNTFFLDALARFPAQFRGVAVIEPDIDAATLDAMARQGVAGIRLNLIGRPMPDVTQPVWQRLITHINTLGWHIEIQREAGDLPRIVAPLLAQGCRIVVDHFGRPDPALGVQDPGFRYLLDTADSGRVWVKLSAAYRTLTGPAGAAFGKQAAALLLRAFTAQRLVWGSDWPNTQYRDVVDYAATRRALDDWIDSAQDRHAILDTTPAELFGFDTTETCAPVTGASATT